MPQPVIDRIPAGVRLLTEENLRPGRRHRGIRRRRQREIAAANRTEYGLASYFYTRDLNRAARVTAKLRISGDGGDRSRRHLPDAAAPFGGTKRSGFGRERRRRRHRRLPRDQVRRDLDGCGCRTESSPGNDHPLTRQPTDHLLPARNGVASTWFPLGASERIHEPALTIRTSCLPAARPTAHAYPTWPIAVQQPRPSSSDPESRAAPTIRTCRRWSGFTWSVLRSS